jgi:hypothetical protein
MVRESEEISNSFYTHSVFGFIIDGVRLGDTGNSALVAGNFKFNLFFDISTKFFFSLPHYFFAVFCEIQCSEEMGNTKYYYYPLFSTGLSNSIC